MERMNTGDKLVSVLKADLLLSDYTLSSDEEEKHILLNLLDGYIAEIDDPKLSIIFSRLTTTENTDERELYTEILTDILSDYKNNTNNA